MYGKDQADERCFKVKTNDSERHQYEGNKNPSATEFAREGYATLVQAGRNPYTRQDRPVLGPKEDEYGYLPMEYPLD
ncbi:MAG: hypothetical protein AB7O44_30350 [Hyphomicrobiaceae bacterium]